MQSRLRSCHSPWRFVFLRNPSDFEPLEERFHQFDRSDSSLDVEECRIMHSTVKRMTAGISKPQNALLA
jgi:hypothetical protein